MDDGRLAWRQRDMASTVPHLAGRPVRRALLGVDAYGFRPPARPYLL